MTLNHLKEGDIDAHYCERWYRLLSAAFLITIVMLAFTLTCVMLMSSELSEVAPGLVDNVQRNEQKLNNLEQKLDALMQYHGIKFEKTELQQ